MFMAKKGQRSAQAKRDRKPQALPLPELWSPPPADECDEDTILVEPDPENRVIMRLLLWNNQMVSYAVVHATRVGGEWTEVSSIDCCHNEVHRHKGIGHGQPETIRPIYSQLDVQSSLDNSYDEIYNGYLEFKDKQ